MDSGKEITIKALDGEGVGSQGTVSGRAPHKITLNGNGGTFRNGSQSAEMYKAAASLVSGGDLETAERDGHYLSGWTREDGSAVAFPLEIGQPMSLTAQWKQNPAAGGGSGTGSGTGSGGGTGSGTGSGGGTSVTTYTITYNLGGGTNDSDNPASYNVETQTITLKPATRTGYTFGGWEKDGSPITQIAKGTTGDMTLTARWTANTYTVKFDGNGNDGGTSMDDQTFTYDDAAQSLNPNSFTRTNQVFDKWTTDKEGKGASYTDGQNMPNLPAANGETVTIYAQWTITAATVADYIESLSGPGPHGVTVTGSMSENQVFEIKSALQTLAGSDPNAQVSLDLSGVTGLTELPSNAFYDCTHS